MIYFAQSVDGGPIKIGFSEDVRRRIKQLESHYRQSLVLLAEMDGDQDTEAEIHERFASARFGRSEQFQPTPELMAFIGRPLFAEASPVDPMEPQQPNSSLIAVKCYQEYKDWITRSAQSERDSIPVLIDKALVHYASVRGYPPPPPRLIS